jgi:16S rRNA (guanine527-N7)-methyltransferase
MLTQAQEHLLTEGARILGVNLDDTHLAHFSLYLEELRHWAKVTHLVSQTEPELIIRKHFLDSLAVAPLLSSGSQLLDLGSGAGFPGLILAILSSSRAVVLIEARRKRANFLKTVTRLMKLQNVIIYEGRAEILAKEPPLRNMFDLVMTRATWSLPEFLQLAHVFVREEGLLIAMKGPQGEKELSDATAILHNLGLCFIESHKYNLPFGLEQRQALIFRGTFNVTHDGETNLSLSKTLERNVQRDT